jgi:hypothetical protein
VDVRGRSRAAGRGTLNVERLAPGLWLWTAPDPAAPGAELASVYYEAPDAVVLVDPRIPGAAEEERFWSALDRDVERLGLPVAVLFTGTETADAARFRERYRTTAAVPAGVRVLAGAFLLEAPDALVVGASPPPAGATSELVVSTTAPR